MGGFIVLRCLIYSLAFPVITIAVHLNPSGHPPPSPFAGPGQCALFAAGLYALSFLAFWIPWLFRTKKAFLWSAIASLLFLLATVGFLGIRLHRDYFSAAFQFLLSFTVVLLARHDLLFGETADRHAIRNSYRASMVVFMMSFCWVMLMGYAIATRQEPRWAESIFYNIYTALLLTGLYLQITQLQSRMYRRVMIGADRIMIDQYDFTSYLGETNLRIVVRLARHPGRNIRCADLVADILPPGEPSPCSLCVQGSAKASRCPRYKTLYNRILDIKKLFESLEIGTVIYPENKMRIVEEGWKLRFFDDIRVIQQMKTIP